MAGAASARFDSQFRNEEEEEEEEFLFKLVASALFLFLFTCGHKADRS